MIVIRAAQDIINGVAFSPDGRLIAAACADGWLKVWDAARVGTGDPLWVDQFHGLSTSHVQFSPDGKLIFVSGSHGAGVWTTATGPPGAALPSTRSARGPASVVVCSRDGQFVAWAGGFRGSTNRIAVARIKPRGFHKSFSGHDDEIGILAASPDGLISGSADRKIRFWTWASGHLYHELSLRGFVRTLAVAPGGEWLAGSCAKSILLWPLHRSTGVKHARPGKPRELRGHTKRVSCVEFATDGATLVSAGDDGTLRLWDVATGAERRVLDPGLGALHWLAFAPDGLTLAFTSDKGHLGVLDLDG
ncbi:WD40 repeat domain-containing protein [Frigoriglobus tundricola]|uniref:WD40 repeat domain-containing protein n=1 Tax=Frigoriglobus tundricola TaxID=2774151 RepID=A0A6M5YI17_9BACT|nr:WD40 repeat domain-containing protein [Frigoriglobus tundricola]QJW93719.1 hypothetical protein FTUN_1230 [Frigoriglobus tundricola]